MATSNQNSPMAAIGGYESVLPFKAIGLDVVLSMMRTKLLLLR